MRTRVNGDELEVADGAPLATVLAARGVPGAGVAVAVDGAVVPRTQWAQTVLTDGAVIEIVTAVQGG